MKKSLTVKNRKIETNVVLYNTNDSSKTKTYIGLIDTGSQETCISNNVVSELELNETGEYVNIAGSDKNITKSKRYYCVVQIEGISKGFTLESPTHPREDIDIIIGMDILEQFEITLKNNIFSLEIN